jgi:hypothetical protein
LKLQTQNIVDCELAEVIDDETLGRAPYKAEQVLKEIMTRTEADIAKATENLAGADRGSQGDPTSPGKPGGKSPITSNDPTSPKQARSGARSGAGVPAGSSLAGGEEQDAVSEEENEEERVAPKGKQRGELYGRLWEQTPFVERQLRAVYKQIGIDPDEQYDEGVLEEYIILKAVRDFNHSKFATEEHLLIEGVIKDVFQGAVPDLDKPVQDYGNLKDALHQSFDVQKLDFSRNLQNKAL